MGIIIVADIREYLIFLKRGWIMKKNVSITVALCLVALISSSVFAGPVVPDWRGEDGSTHQIWTFDDDSNPAVPSTVDNPNGDPTALIEDDNPADMWWIDTNRGHDGVWKTEGYVTITIPNTQLTGLNTYKKIVVQMVYDAGADIDAWLRFSADDSPVSDGIKPIDSEDLGDGYRYSRWEITIEPNPTTETLYMLPFYCNLYVDSVEVDTICIPEPATMAMLGIGGLLTLIRRRK